MHDVPDDEHDRVAFTLIVSGPLVKMYSTGQLDAQDRLMVGVCPVEQPPPVHGEVMVMGVIAVPHSVPVRVSGVQPFSAPYVTVIWNWHCVVQGPPELSQMPDVGVVSIPTPKPPKPH
ncbi:MAG: hypothetical protein IT541_17625 [Hyphomicrobiales bacterium]|nr:hypothetical protein [Hyphomicrobiales bacterium]